MDEEAPMANYLYIFRGGMAGTADQSPAQMQQHMQKWNDWIQALTKTGNFKSGEPLEAGGKTISGKRKNVTDGPFAEAKDLVGGYLLVTAQSLDQAVELAHGCPILEVDGSVEVRAVRQM
jgi:hypothetical protein